MADTVIQGPPSDPLDEFRSAALPAWARAGEYRDVIYEVAEGIARITINRPEVRNAFRPQTLFELANAFERARDDVTVGVIILTGAGNDAFCSGGDQRIRGDDGYMGDDDVAQHGVGRLNVLDLQIQIRTSSVISHSRPTTLALARPGLELGPSMVATVHRCSPTPLVSNGRRKCGSSVANTTQPKRWRGDW